MRTTISIPKMNGNDVQLEKIEIPDVEKEINNTYFEIRDEAEGILLRAKDLEYDITKDIKGQLKIIEDVIKDNNNLYFNEISDIDFNEEQNLVNKSRIGKCLSKLFELRSKCLSIKMLLEDKRMTIKNEL